MKGAVVKKEKRATTYIRPYNSEICHFGFRIEITFQYSP